ncbi:MAG: hypothetical protein GY768_14920 [Planctomycetaceae bacterium]|nr:hypothetical protein [Planctomycetaceae bacterium]
MQQLRSVIRPILAISIVALTIGSLQPSNGGGIPSMNDKLLHFVAYAFVGLLAIAAFRRRANQVGLLLSLTALGVALEFGQLFVPGRAFELWDMAANSCGTFAAFTTSRIFPNV